MTILKIGFKLYNLSYDPSRVSEISARFSGPVTPGNTLLINVWNQDSYTIANVIEKETNSVVLKDFIVKPR